MKRFKNILRNILILINTLLLSASVLFIDYSLFDIAFESSLRYHYYFQNENIKEIYFDSDGNRIEKALDEHYSIINGAEIHIRVSDNDAYFNVSEQRWYYMTDYQYDEMQIDFRSFCPQKETFVRINRVKISDKSTGDCIFEKYRSGFEFMPDTETEPFEKNEVLHYIGSRLGVVKLANYRHEYDGELTFEVDVEVECNGTVEAKTIVFDTLTRGYRYPFMTAFLPDA